MLARTVTLSSGEGRRHPVTKRSASLIPVSMRWVYTLQHQRGAQYSAIEYTRDKVAVQRTAALAPHPDLASHHIWATHEVSFPRSDSKVLVVRKQPVQFHTQVC